MLKQVDWWFAYTQMTVDLLKSSGYPGTKIACLDNSIDTSGFKADLDSWSSDEIDNERAKLGIKINVTVGLFCGSLYADKKLELLIESADLIRKEVPDFSVLIIGDGPSMPQLQEAAATRPWLHLLGVRKGREKALYFRMSDVMLNPGLVGLHIVDAFCSGLVMITTRNARHSPEYAYLRDGVNGLAVDDTPETYSRAVLGLISNPGRLAQMQQAALADSERYTLENMVNRFADGIEAALRD
jgi:glycosyltransferase involved in cell wall biosynthesis